MMEVPTALFKEMEEFVDRHSESWYTSGQDLLARIRAVPVSRRTPTDDQLIEFAIDEEFLLFCDEDEFMQIARAVLSHFAR